MTVYRFEESSYSSDEEATSSNLVTPTNDQPYRQPEIRQRLPGRQDVAKRQAPKPLALGLRESAESFLAEVGYSRAARTHETYTACLGDFLTFMDRQRVADLQAVNADHCRRWLLDLSRRTYVRSGQVRPLSSVVVRLRFDTVACFFKWCVVNDRLDYSPLIKVKAPPVDRRVRFAFPQDEARRLAKYAAKAPGDLKYRDTLIVSLLLGGGLRASELCGLRWSNVEWANGTIVVFGKGSKERRVKLGSKSMLYLKEWQRRCPVIPGGWVFVTQRKTQMQGRTLWAMIHNLGEYAGVENAHPHRLRHTFAAEYTKAHRDTKATQAALGHSKLRTTDEYLNSLGMNYHLERNYSTPDEWLS